MNEDKLHCPICLSTNIQHQSWVDPNKEEILDVLEDSYAWCNECDLNSDHYSGYTGEDKTTREILKDMLLHIAVGSVPSMILAQGILFGLGWQIRAPSPVCISFTRRSRERRYK